MMTEERFRRGRRKKERKENGSQGVRGNQNRSLNGNWEFNKNYAHMFDGKSAVVSRGKRKEIAQEGALHEKKGGFNNFATLKQRADGF